MFIIGGRSTEKENIRAKMEPANDDQSEDGQLRSPYNNEDDMGDNDRFVFKLHKTNILFYVERTIFIHFIFNIA